MTSKTGADHFSSEAKSLMDGKDALSALTVSVRLTEEELMLTQLLLPFALF